MTKQTEQHSEYQRQPDIEVYIKNCTVEEIITWLNTTFDEVDAKDDLEKTSINLTCKLAEQTIPLTIYIGAAGKLFTSLWFQSDRTPWASDIDCASQIADTLNKEVRCATNGWEESEDSDNQWWKVTKEGKEVVSW